MKAVRVEDGVVQIADVDEPVGDGVVVTIDAAGICGSDLHLIDMGFLAVIPGHELAGRTPDGTPVAIEPMFSCGTCVACLDHREPHCPGGLTRTLGIGLDGGMAERVAVPERFLVPLAPTLATADACLVEPTAVAVRSLARAGARQVGRIAVIGGGPIGICAVAVARSWGLEVDLIARHDHQRAAGARVGAGEATDQPYDVVVDAAGTESSLAEAVDRCAVGGTVGIAATYWSSIAMPGMAMGMKEISLVPSITYGHTTGPRDVEVAAAVVAGAPELASAVITHRYPLDAAPEAFATARDRAGGAIKVVLEPAR